MLMHTNTMRVPGTLGVFGAWREPGPVMAGPGWAPGHKLAAPATLGQNGFFLDAPALSLIGNAAIAVGAGFVIPKAEGAWNTIAWVVTIVAGLRALNDFSKLRGGGE